MLPTINSAEILRFHRFLLGETHARLDLFQRAIAATVQRGDTVVDLGAGTGILSFLACRAGARRVYAIEMGPAVELARLLARENGFEDQIVILEGASDDVELPEQADVLVTDIYDTCGLQPGGLNALVTARRRFLKPGGRMIPESVALFAAPAQAPDVYRCEIDFWSRQASGIDLSPVRQFATNNMYSVRLEPDAFLAEPASVAELELHRLDTPAFQGRVDMAAERPGLLHGLCVWFSAALTGDVVISNRPGITTSNYAQGFFPIPQPLAVGDGDCLDVALSSYDFAEWRWRVAVRRRATSAGPDACFDQCTFLGFPLGKLRPQDQP